MRRTTPLAVRFWRHVEKSEGCWIWVGARSSGGYGKVWVEDRLQQAHRVAYMLEYGAPLPEKLDHRCREKLCVRPSHLRPTTTKQNLENLTGAYRSNMSSGILGVTWNRRSGRWVAQVQSAGIRYYLGLFDTPEEAGAVAMAKRLELFTYNDLDRQKSRSEK